MSATKVTESDVRGWMKDLPELNPLLDGVRFSSEDIERAQMYVVDYYNMLPPPVSTMYTVENFPHMYLLLVGTCAFLLKGAAVNQASNNLSYSAEGVQVDDMNKASVFMQMGDKYWSEYTDMAKQVKINRNVAAAYGSVFSEYAHRVR